MTTSVSERCRGWRSAVARGVSACQRVVIGVTRRARHAQGVAAPLRAGQEAADALALLVDAAPVTRSAVCSVAVGSERSSDATPPRRVLKRVGGPGVPSLAEGLHEAAARLGVNRQALPGNLDALPRGVARGAHGKLHDAREVVLVVVHGATQRGHRRPAPERAQRTPLALRGKRHDAQPMPML